MNKNPLKICIIGTGYVGLVTGVGLSSLGHRVECVDKDIDKINLLRRSISPIYEVGLEKIIKKNLNKNLFFTNEIKKSIKENEVIFIAVGTPENKDGSTNLSYIESTAGQLAKYINGYKLIINKSTVPVGTLFKVKEIIKKTNHNNFDLASNPEFLREGRALLDFLRPDRIVVGAETNQAFSLIELIYAPLLEKLKKNILVKMDIPSAELTKYVANAMLATRISFINEVSILAEKVNANIKDIQKGISLDKRIGKYFLNAGLGYGGSCFPKDVSSILYQAKSQGNSLNVINGTKKSNQQQRQFFFSKISNYFKNKLEKKVISIWGLTFKPETDDIRESISIYLIKKLIQHKAILQVHDPKGIIFIKNIFKNKIFYFSNQYEALEKAEALVLATEWKTYLNPDKKKMEDKMKKKIIFDGRNVLEQFAKENNFKYFGVGLN